MKKTDTKSSEQNTQMSTVETKKNEFFLLFRLTKHLGIEDENLMLKRLFLFTYDCWNIKLYLYYFSSSRFLSVTLSFLRIQFFYYKFECGSNFTIDHAQLIWWDKKLIHFLFIHFIHNFTSLRNTSYDTLFRMCRFISEIHWSVGYLR